MTQAVKGGEPGVGAAGALRPEVNSSQSLLCVRRAAVCSFALISIFAYPWQEALVVAGDFHRATGCI